MVNGEILPVHCARIANKLPYTYAALRLIGPVKLANARLVMLRSAIKTTAAMSISTTAPLDPTLC
jgi:hypothetical protein